MGGLGMSKTVKELGMEMDALSTANLRVSVPEGASAVAAHYLGEKLDLIASLLATQGTVKPLDLDPMTCPLVPGDRGPEGSRRAAEESRETVEGLLHGLSEASLTVKELREELAESRAESRRLDDGWHESNGEKLEQGLANKEVVKDLESLLRCSRDDHASDHSRLGETIRELRENNRLLSLDASEAYEKLEVCTSANKTLAESNDGLNRDIELRESASQVIMAANQEFRECKAALEARVQGLEELYDAKERRIQELQDRVSDTIPAPASFTIKENDDGSLTLSTR